MSATGTGTSSSFSCMVSSSMGRERWMVRRGGCSVRTILFLYVERRTPKSTSDAAKIAAPQHPSAVARGRLVGKVGLDGGGELRGRHRLQPDVAGTMQLSEEQRVAEELVLDALDGRELQLHLSPVQGQVSGVDQQRLARLEVVLDDLAG